MEKKPISNITAGLVIAGIAIVYSMCLNFLGQGTNRALGWVLYLILIVGIIIFINLYAKAKDNRVSYGNLFGYGFKTTAMIIVVFIVFLVVFNLAYPEFKEKILDESRKQMEEKGKLSDSEIDQAIEMVRKFYWVGMIGGTMVIFAIVGAIASLIGAAIPKKYPNNPLEQLDQMQK